MDIKKKVFIEDGLSGIIFILCGVGVQLVEKFSDLSIIIFGIIFIALIFTIVVVKIRTWKRRSQTVDELAEISILKAKSVVYDFVLVIGLGATFFIHLFSEDKFQIHLNWGIFMIIYGCCYLFYSLLFQYYYNKGKTLKDQTRINSID